MAKIRYIGEEAEITEAGFTFKGGKAQEVPESHPRFAKLSNNPTFEVVGGSSAPAKSSEEAPEPGPLDGSVPDLEEHLQSVNDADEIDSLLEQERAGKTRKGAIDALEARKAELEG